MTTEATHTPPLIPVSADLYINPAEIAAVASVPQRDSDERVTLLWITGTGEIPFYVNRPIGEVIDLIAAARSMPSTPDDASALDHDDVVRVCMDCGEAYATRPGTVHARERYPRCETCRK